MSEVAAWPASLDMIYIINDMILMCEGNRATMALESVWLYLLFTDTPFFQTIF